VLALGDGDTDHVAMAAAIYRHLPDLLVSIEMLPTRNESHLDTIERALNVAIQHYRNQAPSTQP
jgi:hypothetical protein